MALKTMLAKFKRKLHLMVNDLVFYFSFQLARYLVWQQLRKEKRLRALENDLMDDEQPDNK